MSRKLLAVAMLLMAAHAAWGQSLAEVARREEARRKAIRTPAKVYTNDDLRGVSGPGTTVTADVKPLAEAPAGSPPTPGTTIAQGTTPGPPPPPAAADKAQKDQKGEEYWRKRLTDARLDLDRNRGYAEAMQSRVNALAAEFSARDDPAQRAQIGANRQKALAELDRLAKEIANGTKAITDIQEEARRAGVPAGWVR